MPNTDLFILLIIYNNYIFAIDLCFIVITLQVGRLFEAVVSINREKTNSMVSQNWTKKYA